MQVVSRFRLLALCALLTSAACAATAQGAPHQDQDRDHPGGPDRAAEGRPAPRGQAQGQDNRRFRDDDRGRYYSHFQGDADQWRGRQRPAFAPGQRIAPQFAVRPVPRSFWAKTPPPPGYRYGYYGGYVVLYNPTTRIIADVLDLVGAANGH